MKVGGTFKGWKDMETPLGQEKAGKLCFVMYSATFCTFHAKIRTKKTRSFFPQNLALHRAYFPDPFKLDSWSSALSPLHSMAQAKKARCVVLS